MNCPFSKRYGDEKTMEKMKIERSRKRRDEGEERDVNMKEKEKEKVDEDGWMEGCAKREGEKMIKIKKIG